MLGLGWPLILGIAAALVSGLLPLIRPGAAAELWTQDLRLLLRGPRVPRHRIVIAEIGESTARRWKNEPLVMWGGHLAQAIRNARSCGARVIALDLINVVPADDYLEQVVGTVLSAARLSPEEAAKARQTLEDHPTFWPVRSLSREIHASPSDVVLADAANLLPDPLKFAGEPYTQLGLVDLPTDADGSVRQLPFYYTSKGANQIRLSLSAAIAAAANGLDPISPATPAKILRQGIDREANYTINPVTPDLGDAFETLPLEELADSHAFGGYRDQLKGSIILMGATFEAARDKHRGPFGQPVHGVQLHAAGASTLLDGAPLRRWQEWTGIAVAEVFALLLVVVVASLPAVGLRVAVAGLVLGGWTLFACWSYSVRGEVAPLAAPVLAPLFAIAVFEGANTVGANLERLRMLLRLYLSPVIGDLILTDAAARRLGGCECEASVMFVDVRDSTSYGEGLEPAELLNDLNRFYSAVVPALEAHGGILYQYQGDGFLAVFGAPKPIPNHQQAAIDASMSILAAVRKLNEEGGRADGRPWRAGCGIHSGRLVWGNIGHALRQGFTVIGDTANVASRLEAKNRELESAVVVSAAVAGVSRLPAGFLGPTWVAVKGRTESLQVYHLPEDQAWKASPGLSATGAGGAALNEIVVESRESRCYVPLRCSWWRSLRARLHLGPLARPTRSGICSTLAAPSRCGAAKRRL